MRSRHRHRKEGAVSARANTFAGQLRHFARAVDIVDNDVFDRVRGLVYKYVKNELGAEYFELLRDQVIDGDAEPALKMFWSNEDKDHFWRVRGVERLYTNLVTQAFGQDQPLWVVAQDRQPLRQAEKLEDQWSHSAELSPYYPPVDQPFRTLVALPLRRRIPLGVFYFESRSYLGITDVAKEELLTLASALTILLELYEVNRTQSKMTALAIFELQENLESAKFPKLAKPHFFVAFSNRADRNVTTVSREVLLQFSDRLEFTDWTEMTDSGNISAQIAREITRSRFGICYLSELVKAGEADSVSYIDNPNVVFEAGMLHATTAATEAAEGAEPAGWIPMRETASPPAPFDFAAERTLYVPRFKNGTLQEDRLRETLTQRVMRLLGED